MPPTRPYVIDPEPRPTDRRELKKARTRQELVDAAVELFTRQGFDATTVEDIAAAANVSPRTFFRYFANKEEVLFHRREDDLAHLEGALAKRPDDEPVLHSVREAVVSYVSRYQEDPEFHLLRFRLISESRTVEAYVWHVHTEWIQVLAEGVARRTGLHPVRDIFPNLLAGAATQAIRATFVTWAISKGRLDITELMREAFGLMESGFAPPSR